MQCLRETLDAREFETRLTAMRYAGTRLDAIDLAEIAAMRNCIDECDEIARLIRGAIAQDESAKCVASCVATALLAVDDFAASRSEHWDSTKTNDGTIDAWGWTDETPEGEMAWRCTIRIIEESDL